MCPSEAWPAQVIVDQRDIQHQHQMVVNLPQAKCSGALTEPDPGTCGTGTNNPNCDLVCGGDVTVQTAQAFGVIGEAGDSFRLYLGGGIVTNGINCAMLGYSVADADLDTTGDKGADWEAAVAHWESLRTDDDAAFDKEIVLDASTMTPFVTWGTNPGQGVPLAAAVPSPQDCDDDTDRIAAEKALE